MREIVFTPARFHQRDAFPALLTQLPICGLVLLVSIPAAVLTALVMGCVHAVRFITKAF